MIVAVDFNLPEVNCTTGDDGNCRTSMEMVSRIMNMGYEQAVTEETSDLDLDRSNLLEAVLVKPDHTVDRSEVLDDDLSDHKAVVVYVLTEEVHGIIQTLEKQVWCYKKKVH